MSEHGIYRATPLTLADGQQSRISLTSRGAVRFAQEDAAGNPAGQLTAGTDRSGTAGTSSATLAPANTARKGLNIQNISANNLGINEFGGTAAIGTPGTYTIPAGGSTNIRTTNAITVIASAASSAYTATEF